MYPMFRIRLYKPLFMLMLIIAIFIFCRKCKKRSSGLIRLILSFIFLIEIAISFPILSDNSVYICTMFIFFWLSVYVLLIVCYSDDKKKLLFYSVMGYTTEHIAYEVYLLLISIFNISEPQQGLYSFINQHLFLSFTDFLIYFISYLFVYSLIYIFFARRIKGTEGIQINNKFLVILGAIFLFVDIFINAFMDNYSKTYYDKTYMITITSINILLCLLFMMFTFEMSLRQELRNDINVLNQLIYNQNNQYKITKENIDIINQKCHDLKYQIREYSNSHKISKDVEEEIANSILALENNIQTGNPALDVIFSEKSSLCSKKNIQFACIADGKLLNFMSECDIYSLFGNLIDNAIEALEDEPQKRIISIQVREQGDFVYIFIQNYCNKKIEFKDGLPITTKENKHYHGFGFYSIKTICQKYNGTLSVKNKNDLFCVSILFFKR